MALSDLMANLLGFDISCDSFYVCLFPPRKSMFYLCLASPICWLCFFECDDPLSNDIFILILIGKNLNCIHAD